MRQRNGTLILLAAAFSAGAPVIRTAAQPPPFDPSGGPFPGPPGFGSPRGPGSAGLPGADRPLVKQFDTDGDGRLNREERQAARAFLKTEGGGRGFRRRPGSISTRPGPRVSPSGAKTYPKAGLYDPGALRTFFIAFDDADWETELSDFRRTDVLVPAAVTVDGKTFRDVGVKFRGTGSYDETAPGQKRSMKLKLDWVHKDQALYGYPTINLNNAFQDPGFMNSVLTARIARDIVPAPKANLAKAVLNGESWGIYVNAQEFDKLFCREWFGSAKGTRWKVPANRFGTAAFTYLGDTVDPYKNQFEMKDEDGEKAWKSLILFCRTLNETPPGKLEAALSPMLDINQALRFLAIENVLINTDGYWSKGSDFNLFLDAKGVFHVVLHDTNETFGPPGVQGFGPGRMEPVEGVELDPLTGWNDFSKPLRGRLLSVPALRERYLKDVREIARRWLDWKTLGPLVAGYRALIDQEIEADTRKLYSTGQYRSVHETASGSDEEIPVFDPTGRWMNLRGFAETRRSYLLRHPAIVKLPAGGPASAASSRAAGQRREGSR